MSMHDKLLAKLTTKKKKDREEKIQINKIGNKRKVLISYLAQNST